MTFRNRLLSTTVVPIVIGVGVGFAVVHGIAPAGAESPFQVAAASNPCNPCAAANPCAASEAAEVTDEEATLAYTCIKGSLKAGYIKSNLSSSGGLNIAADYQDWNRYSTRSYVSDTHGGRFVQNYANSIARDYGKYEDVGKLPVGSVLAKDSFVVRGGQVSAGPLFVMEKMSSGFNAASVNWRYSLVMPDGKVIGTTNGTGSKNVEFCYGCHATAENTDSLFLVPEEYRVTF